MTELPTYTSVFRLERRLYAIYDWELPTPVALSQVGVFLAAAGVFWLLGVVLGIEPTAGSAWFFLVPPAFVSYLARTPVADHKQPHRWLASQVRYLVEPRLLHRLAEPREPAVVTVRASAWRERPRR